MHCRTFALLVAALFLSGLPARGESRPNVLFISVDDLRPQLGCHGNEMMHTPNLDRLAEEGRLFLRHYVQVPTCGASRYALLTGRRPLQRLHSVAFANDGQPGPLDVKQSERTALGNGAFSLLPRKEGAGPVTLPHLFRQNGYETVCLGKISHSPDGRRRDGKLEVPFAWDRASTPAGPWKTAWNAFFAYAGGGTRQIGKTPNSEAADVPDTGYPDGRIAEAAIGELRRLRDRPFFLAVGFYKPHLPFNAPQRYWDRYDRDSIDLAEHREPPENVDPSISLHNSGELTPRYSGLATPGKVTADEARRLRHAYYACTSYIDAQVGKLLGELDRLGLRENTVVVVWGDHGWHLGEHGIWGKHTLHEVALRSTLIVRTPEPTAAGEATRALVETVDLYPTLCELCRLPAPEGLHGQSLAALLENPSHPGERSAYSYWRKGKLLGLTRRSDRYRLTRWLAADGSTAQLELYDHHDDPKETANLAPERPQLVESLMKEAARSGQGPR